MASKSEKYANKIVQINQIYPFKKMKWKLIEQESIFLIERHQAM